MKKVFSKVTAIVLALAMAAAVSPSVPRGSEAKTKNTNNSLTLSIQIKNKDELCDLTVEDSAEIELKFKVSGGTKKEQKEAKKVKAYVKDSNIAKVITTKNGGKEVIGLKTGKTKLFVESKVKKNGKPIAKASCNIEVSEELDMVFKYSNLYFVVPEGTAFPIEVAKGGADAQNHPFDIKTKGFEAKMSDFSFASETAGIADVDASAEKLILKGYGSVDIEAEYKKDDSIGDSFECYVVTPAQFEKMKAEGDVSNDPENTFEGDDESTAPNEPEESGDDD